MQVYLVGGAVRDQLLGLPIKERDWVVVGATPQDMLRLGYRPVGKDFPVFLHPETHEEYALARTERKVAKGYKGFNVYAAADVTLEDDLKRRDLTINAIAQTADGQLIDPYNGKRDLEAQILRHVSPAFAEDPVRILRLARFAARFADFKVHPETMQLMQSMVVAGEVAALVAERVWQELVRALSEKQPQRFFQILHDCQAAAVLFPQLSDKKQAIVALEKACQITNEVPARFAAFVYGCTEQEVNQLCQRYKLPREYSELAILVVRWQQKFAELITHFSAAALLSLLEKLDGFRRPERLELFLTACQANLSQVITKQAKQVVAALAAARQINTQELGLDKLPPATIATAIHQARLTAIEKFLASEEKN